MTDPMTTAPADPNAPAAPPASTEPQMTATPEEIEEVKANIESRYRIPAASRLSEADKAAAIISAMHKNKGMQADVQKEADEAADKLISQPPASASAVEHQTDPNAPPG
jgi:hypothetical protein